MSNIVDLSYGQTLMDTDNQSNLLFYDNNTPNLSSVNTFKNYTFMELYDVQSALYTFESILSNGATIINRNLNSNQNEQTDSDRQQLLNIVQIYNDRQTLIDLMVKFVVSYNIYLHFIGFNQGKFKIINEYSFPGSFPDKDERRRLAFVVLNGDNTICGPLFTDNFTGGIQTVFAFDDMRIMSEVDKYIEKLNQTDSRSFPLAQENPISTTDQNSSNDMLVDDISALPVDFNSEFHDLSKNTVEIPTPGDQIVQQIIPTNNTFSTLRTIPLSVQEPDSSLQQNYKGVISSNEGNNNRGNTACVREADQVSAHTSPPESTHPSNTMQDSQTIHTSKSTQVIYVEQEIVTDAKPVWNPRYPKDLIPEPKKESKGKLSKASKHKTKTKKQTNKKENVTFIELLQGIGGQRSRIKVKVPSKAARTMYLATTVRTVNNQRHSSKVIVQEKTKVNKDLFNHENDLKYLEFDECNSMHFFDPIDRIVYMEITSKEHEKEFKEVPVYMFNLYQTSRLTKKMIELEQLDKCKLAFWLCFKEGGDYIRISQESFSGTITERKKKTNKNPP